jgi:hypothetical protein
MIVPGGEHTIEFKFEPQVIKRGSVTLIGMLLECYCFRWVVFIMKGKKFKNVD